MRLAELCGDSRFTDLWSGQSTECRLRACLVAMRPATARPTRCGCSHLQVRRPRAVRRRGQHGRAPRLRSKLGCYERCLETHGGYDFVDRADVERKFHETRRYQVAPVNNNLIKAFSAPRSSACPLVLIRRLSATAIRDS